MWLQSLEGSHLTAYITFTCGAGFALFGYDQGIFGGLLQNDSFVKTFNNPDSTMQGQITATYDLGCFFGALFAMWLGDRSGRKRTILWGCITLIIGATLQSTSFHVSQMIVGRFVAGVGNGMNTATIPVWQSETAAARHRGRFMVFQLFLNQFGNVMAQWINYGFKFIAANSVAWRFPLAFQCMFAILTLVFLPMLPESPRWLIMKSRNEEAFSILKRLKGSTNNEQDSIEAFNIIAQSIQHEREAVKFTFKDLAKSDSLHTTRRVLLGAGTQLMQQWGGINVINYYLPLVFSSLGISRNLSLILSACNAMNLMISTSFGALYIETFGRKRMMLWGAVGQSICFALVATGLGIATRKWEAVAVAFVFAYYTTFGLTWIAVPWLYPAEINTQRMRIAGAGISTATNWINNYIVVLVTPIGIANIGWKYYLIYAVLNAVFVPVVGFFYVETAGLSLEQIDTLFEGENAVMNHSTSDQHTEKRSDYEVAHVSDVVDME